MMRTTIFLSEELHEALRRDAFRASISMAELIRQKLTGPASRGTPRSRSKDPLLKVAGTCSGPILSGGIDTALYGK